MIKVLTSLISRLSKREKIIFYITIFLVFSLALTCLILSPAFSRIEILDKEINEQKKIIKNNILILSRKDEITAEYNKYTPYFEKAESKSEDPILFLKSIENLAKNSSLEILDIKPAASQEGASIKEYFINLSCEAPMEKIFDFLYNVENLEQLLSVERILISPKEDENNVVKCNVYISKILILPGDSELTVK